MAKDGRLGGKVALVTGGARGIGLAIARRFVAEGAKVVIGDIDGREAIAAATAIGPESDVLGRSLDITRDEQVAATVGEVEGRFGRLDILVNNAAILDMTTWDELTYARFQEVLRVNLDGALLCAMAAVPALERAGGGRILNTASIMGLVGSKESIPYSTA
ncbi:MAG TPA: SDR family oxidoreductase, partial [Geminicoccaceae bacterium]|nr:SDR family oxidoreductase [Geminicoccaceae bacterium]